jgi:hypothetical protein
MCHRLYKIIEDYTQGRNYEGYHVSGYFYSMQQLMTPDRDVVRKCYNEASSNGKWVSCKKYTVPKLLTCEVKIKVTNK